MKKKSVGVNAALNVMRQGLSILFPLITYPYALRVLGADGIGKVNYGSSIVSYFALIATLGTTDYIVREGARRKDDTHLLEEFSSEVYTINFRLTILSYLLLVVLLFSLPKFSEYKYLILLQSLTMIFTTLGTDWINTIYEDFTRITIRSICTYSISFILLFLLVRSPKDYYFYAALGVITTAVICVSNRLYFRKFIHIKLVKNTNFKSHFPVLCTLFANTLALTINTDFDITMLGWVKGDYYVGLYSLAGKVFAVIRNMVAAIYKVAIPRLSYYLGLNDLKSYRELSTRICSCLIIMIVPASVGLFFNAEPIALIMGGEQMSGAVRALQLLSIALVFTTLSGMVMSAMNVSLCREKENLTATALGAGINVGLNLVFIPLFSHNGAAFTTLISELFLLFFLIIRFKKIREYLDIGIVRKELLHALAGSGLIVICSLACRQLIPNMLVGLISAVAGSLIVYCLFLKIIKDEFYELACHAVKNKIRNRF